MGLKNEPSITQTAIDVACSVAMATLDELEPLARGRVLGLSVTIRDKAGICVDSSRQSFGDARPIRYGLTGLADARSAADANTISNHL